MNSEQKEITMDKPNKLILLVVPDQPRNKGSIRQLQESASCIVEFDENNPNGVVWKSQHTSTTLSPTEAIKENVAILLKNFRED